MTYFQSLPQKAEKDLLRKASAVKGVLPEKIEAWEFSTGAFEKEGDARPLIDKIKQWSRAGGRFLYVISRLTDSPSNEVVLQAFEHAKDAEKGERQYARLNEPSSTLYVGSSEKEIHRRIKEHLGFGHKQTYSLQL